MKEIRSGTSTERLLRSSALVVLAGLAGCLFLYDGFVAYPEKNVRAVYSEILQTEPPARLPAVRPYVTAETAARFRKGDPGKDLLGALGTPDVESAGAVIYFGNGGHLRAAINRGKIVDITWQPGPLKTATDIQLQKGIGAAGALAFIVTLARLITMLLARTVLTAQGLSLGRNSIIAFEQMRGMHKGGNAEVVVLKYEKEGKPATTELDRYVIKEQPAIIRAISERTGLTVADEES